MPLEFVDTHCHLAEPPLAAAIPDALGRARAAGVAQVVTIGTTLADSRASIAAARAYAGVRAAVGIHPHEVNGTSEAELRELEALAGEPEVGAIGEVGLDFYRKLSPPERQREVFRACVQIAYRCSLPLAIHCRNAYEELLAILREEARAVRGVIHCASGPPEFISGALSLGLHISFAGNVTFPNAQALRALVPLVPDDRLLLETDAPFLAPQPVRGRPNEPAYLAHTAQAVAQLRGVSVDELGCRTTANARALFGLPAPAARARNLLE